MRGSFDSRCSLRMTTLGGTVEASALFRDAEELFHLVVEEALAGFVGLDPLAVEDELGDGALPYVGLYGVGGSGGVLDVDLFVGDVVLVEEALGFAAVAAPGGRVDGQIHGFILPCPARWAGCACPAGRA